MLSRTLFIPARETAEDHLVTIVQMKTGLIKEDDTEHCTYSEQGQVVSYTQTNNAAFVMISLFSTDSFGAFAETSGVNNYLSSNPSSRHLEVTLWCFIPVLGLIGNHISLESGTTFTQRSSTFLFPVMSSQKVHQEKLKSTSGQHLTTEGG